MSGQPGISNLIAMRGRRKGGASAPQITRPEGIAAYSNVFLSHLAARAYSQASVEAHRWALRQFAAWTETRGTHDPAAFIRSDLEAYQLFLHHYRSPRGGKGKGGKSRMLPVGERAAAWLERYLAESRPLFHHQPSETALFLSGYGTRFSPAYLGNWIKKLLKRCGIDKPGSCHLWRHYAEFPKMPSWAGAGPEILSVLAFPEVATRHFQRLCRNSNSLSGGR